MSTAILCSAILGVLLFGLGLAVSLARGASGRNFGYPDDPADRLYKLVRAHGNACEYHPMLAVLMLIVGLRGATTWMLWAMLGATGARMMICIGIVICPTMARPYPLRFVGALGTYVFGLALAVAALLVGRP